MAKFFNYLTLDNYAAFVCLAAGLYLYLRGRKWLREFVIFLTFCILTEVFISFYLVVKYHNNNMLVNYFSFLCTAFYLYLYYGYFSTQPWARAIKVVIFAWAGVSIFLLLNSGHTVTNLPYNAGMVLTASLIFVYFYRVLYVEPYRDLTKEGFFYFSVGLILFFFTSFPVFVFYDELIMNENMPRFYLKLLQKGNLFLYGGYLGFILCPKMRSTAGSSLSELTRAN